MTENEALEEHKKDCRRCKDKSCVHGWDCLQKKDIEVYEELEQYRALGTVEEIQKAMENLPLYQVEHKLLQENQDICTVRECKIAVERMKPKKPDYEADGYADGQLVYDYAKCPICGHDFEYGINDWECKYCSDCGQKLDWK